MLKKDESQIIKLIIEAKNEIDEAETRQAKVPKGRGKCYREIIDYYEDVKNGLWKAKNDITISTGETIKAGTILPANEYEKLDKISEQPNFENCWGDVPPVWVRASDGELFMPVYKYDSHKKYFPDVESRSSSHLFPYNRTPRKSLGYKEHGLEAARDYREFIQDDNGNTIKNPNYGAYITYKKMVAAAPMWKKGSEETPEPDYWILNPNKVKGEEFMVIPLTCEDADEFVRNNFEWLKLIQRYHKLNPIFIRCKKNIRPTDQPKAKEFDIVKPTTSLDIERYSKDVKARTAARVTGQKADVSEMIKTRVNDIMRDKFEENDENKNYYKIFTSRSIPPIIFSRKFLNNHVGELSNDEIFYQGLNYVSFDSDEDFLSKILARAQGKKYDTRIINTFINLKEHRVGDTIKLDVDVRYDGPRKENAKVVLEYYSDESTDTSKRFGLGKNNYIKGRIYKYDNKRNKLTIIIDEILGQASGNKWQLNYLGGQMYYVARRFNKIYRNWDLDKGAQFDITQDEKGNKNTLTRWEGSTPIYRLDTFGYQKPNPSTTLSQLWTLSGTRQGDTFVWNLTMKLKYGTKDDSVFSGNVNFKDYNLSSDYMNNVFNNSVIESTIRVGIDENTYVNNTFISQREFRSTTGANVPEGKIISADEFNQLSPNDKVHFTTTTIVDLLPVREGLEQVIYDFMEKVQAIDPQQALVGVDISQKTFGNLEEVKKLTERIINEIKFQHFKK
jgi:hypothetical protein